MLKQFYGSMLRAALVTCLVAASFSVYGQTDQQRAEQARDDLLQRRLRTEADLTGVTQTVVSGTFANAEAKAALTEFYKIQLERFQMSINQNRLPEIRTVFSKNLAAAAGGASTDVHKEIVATLQREMEKLAADPQKHVAVRHNALLVLGDLDTVVERSKTVPLAAMLPILLRYYDDDKADDSLRVAALVGIHRHAAAGIADKNQVTEIQARMLALLQNNQFLKKASPEAQVFVRQRALGVLKAIRQPGVRNKDDVLKSALGILQEKTSPLLLKAYAAQTIGWLNLSSDHKGDVEAIGKALGQLVVEATTAKQKAEYDQTQFVLYCAEVGIRGPASERPPAPNSLDGAPNSLVRLSDGPLKVYLQELGTRLDTVIKDVEKAKPQPPTNDPDPAVREKQAAKSQLNFESELERAVRPFREWLASAVPAPAK